LQKRLFLRRDAERNQKRRRAGKTASVKTNAAAENKRAGNRS
jgi:hypothetical protein